MDQNKTETKYKDNKVLTIIGIIMLIILVPMLIINCTLIIKSLVNEKEVPNVGGRFPMIVMTGSMEPEIMTGDMIICKSVDTATLREGDVIAFYDPLDNGTAVITHRIVGIVPSKNDSGLSFITKGDANNGEDSVPVNDNDVLGIYRMRIPKLGNVAMFMQTTAGLVICVIIPLALFVGYDIYVRKRIQTAANEETEELLRELEELKREKAARESQQ